MKAQDDRTEYRDDIEILKQKAIQIAEYLKKSKHVVIYTGAGVSTSANIPDYRGPKGIWTLKEKGEKLGETRFLDEAVPSFGHLAIAALHKAGFIHHVVSTNVDGLHIRSGIPIPQISELHGNIYKEICDTCKKPYYRSFDVLGRVKKRFTGRLCEVPDCEGKLKDSIINFGEFLPELELERAKQESRKADLSIILGTSMRVAPANILPTYSYRKGFPLCIINLQKTNFDSDATVRLFGETDVVLECILEHLGLKPLEYSLSQDVLQGQEVVSDVIKVRGFPDATTEDELRNVFNDLGTIQKIFIGTDERSKYSFIAFTERLNPNEDLTQFKLGESSLDVVFVIGKVDWQFEENYSFSSLAMAGDDPLPPSILGQIGSFNFNNLKKVNK